MAVYGWSDQHFNHDKILEYTKRGEKFSNITEHNEYLLQIYLDTVKPGDICYWVGDVIFRPKGHGYITPDELMARVNVDGRINHLVRGNHDYEYYNKHNPEESIIDHWGWASSQDITEVSYGKNNHKFVLCHYPIASWHHAHKGAIHLHGHLHNNPEFHNVPHRFEIGVDCHPEYGLFNFSDLVQMAADQEWEPKSHHA